MSESLIVRFGNVYIGNTTRRRALRVLFHGRPDVVVINEGGRVVHLLRVLRPGYRIRHARQGDRRGRTDVLVATRRRLPTRRRAAIRLSRAMPRIRSNHDRWAVPVLIDHPSVGKVAVVGVHPSPGPEALRGDGSHPIATQYAAAMDRLSALIASLRADGYAVVVAGDVQVPMGALDGKAWDPYAVLIGAGLDIAVTAHLDVIAVDRRLRVRRAGVTEKAGPRTGSDHPFLHAEIRPKEKP